MTTVNNIEAETRQGSGTGNARATRRAGFVPGVIYGGGQEPELCAISPKMLNKEMHTAGFFTKIYSLDMKGAKQQVMAKAVQLHPVSDQPLHIDFMRVSATTMVTVAIPVVFINEDKSPGIKLGGVLNILVHNLEVTAPVNAIPENITIDLAGFAIHDSVHVDAIKFVTGVYAAHPERDYTLATILAPLTEAAEAAEGEATPTT